MNNRSVEIQMFYGASPQIIEKAAKLRATMTETEKMLWEFLRKNKVMGLKFRQQHPIYLFIVDFYCHALKLVIEIDGGYHNRREQKEYDINRTVELENLGITVIRFTNHQVDNDFKNIKQEIIKQCKTRRDELEHPFK
jgi:very-short-patch-repair endonuclease